MESLLAIWARLAGALTHNLLTSGSVNRHNNLHPSSGFNLRSFYLLKDILDGNTSTYWASGYPEQIYPSALGEMEPTGICLEDTAISGFSRAKLLTTAGVVVTVIYERAVEVPTSPLVPLKVDAVLNASNLPCSLCQATSPEVSTT